MSKILEIQIKSIELKFKDKNIENSIREFNPVYIGRIVDEVEGFPHELMISNMINEKFPLLRRDKIIELFYIRYSSNKKDFIACITMDFFKLAVKDLTIQN